MFSFDPKNSSLDSSLILIGYDLSDISKPGVVAGSAKNVVIADSKASSNEVDDREYPTAPTGTTAPGSNEAESHVNAPATPTAAAPLDPTAAAALTLKMKEERKKEREKRKEEELLKKYMAEQEAKQKVIGVSKCGRWLKNSIKVSKFALALWLHLDRGGWIQVRLSRIRSRRGANSCVV